MQTQRHQTSARQSAREHHSPHHAELAARVIHPPANTALRSAMELRYQVYCIECSYLSPDNYPDGAESDEHDEAAKHFYAFDSHDELVGYVRLLRPNADLRFPLQSHCTFSEGAQLPVPGRTAEISRLMLRGDYRRLPDLPDLPNASGRDFGGLRSARSHAAGTGHRRDGATQVLLSLYRQVYFYSRAHGIDHWYAAMERRLARSLQRINIAFKSIGPQTDYYGPVAPYLVNLHELKIHAEAGNPTF